MIVRRSVLLLLFVLLCGAPPLFGQRPEVDPLLQTLLQSELTALRERPLDRPTDPARRDDGPGRSRLLGLDWEGPQGAPRVGMLIRVRDPGALDQLRAVGAQIGSIIGDIVTARVPLAGLPSLVELPSLQRLELARVLQPVHDSSMVAINAHLLRDWNGTQWEGFAGQEIIVGIYDSGLDYRHPSFLRPDGRTRVLGLWDQTDVQAGSPRPIGFDYGLFCDPAALNAGTCQQRDFSGHGTHVAGSAAGNGTTGEDGAAPRYPGVAPRADLLVVKGGNGGFDEARIIDGINWIFQEADRRQKPAVVNLSLGGHFGAHDGTRLHEIAIDRLSGPGRIVVAAAGNSGSNPTAQVPPSYIHAMAQPVVEQTRSFGIEVPQFTPSGTVCTNIFRADDFALVDMWYGGADRIDLTVVRPDGSEVTARYGESILVDAAGTGGILIDNASEGPDPANGDNEAFVFVFNCAQSGVPSAGIWTIRATPTRVATGQRLHLWIGASIFGGKPAVGRLGFDNSHTVAMPGTSRRVVTVGAFVTRRCWPTSTGGTACYNPAVQQELGSIAFFSSIGPTRDGRLKPEITAPGFGIVSALSSAASPDAINVTPDGRHVRSQGTSMAAPHVAGAIALLLQQNGSLTPEEVKEVFQLSAQQDRFTANSYTGLPGDAGVPNFTWGYGKLDAFASVAAVGDLVAVEVAVDAPAQPAPPITQAGAVIPLLRLGLAAEGDRGAAVNTLAFDVTGQDQDTARVVVFQDVAGTGAIDPGDTLVGQSETISLTTGDTVAVTVPVSVQVPAGDSIILLVGIRTSGAVPNAATFSARFDPSRSRGPGTLVRGRAAPDARFQAPVRTTVLQPDEAFALSQNPVRFSPVIFNFRTRPRTAGVYTVSGRRVADLMPRIGRALRLEWDLTNDVGVRVSPGVYLLVFDIDGQVVREKLIVTGTAPAGERE